VHGMQKVRARDDAMSLEIDSIGEGPINCGFGRVDISVTPRYR
jgi:hypothetical protein